MDIFIYLIDHQLHLPPYQQLEFHLVTFKIIFNILEEPQGKKKEEKENEIQMFKMMHNVVK